MAFETTLSHCWNTGKATVCAWATKKDIIRPIPKSIGMISCQETYTTVIYNHLGELSCDVCDPPKKTLTLEDGLFSSMTYLIKKCFSSSQTVHPNLPFGSGWTKPKEAGHPSPTKRHAQAFETRRTLSWRSDGCHYNAVIFCIPWFELASSSSSFSSSIPFLLLDLLVKFACLFALSPFAGYPQPQPSFRDVVIGMSHHHRNCIMSIGRTMLKYVQRAKIHFSPTRVGIKVPWLLASIDFFLVSTIGPCIPQYPQVSVRCCSLSQRCETWVSSFSQLKGFMGQVVSPSFLGPGCYGHFAP